ncbi:MAG: 2-amino-4-hydroxy-6-hydroxymethyldihydropteridine diphosphokinase [Opitutaceae bacterium]|nr:2-amino-4-hydroxy-6-hydroxymethyldihydropteridine diphosphokinase [Opitutaceae bacterium]
MWQWKPHAAVAEYWLGLGSNLGDRRAMLAAALRGLLRLPGGRVVAVSPLYQTTPVGVLDQPDFLNLAAAYETPLEPEAMLAAALAVEKSLGRERRERWGPRSIDVDLLWYSGGGWSSPTLVLPHPRMLERAFVLQPLAAIRGEVTVAGRLVREWADEVGADGVRMQEPLAWGGEPR